MKPLHTYRLKRDNTTYYYVDAAGVVATSPTPVNLEAAVVDWKTFQMRWTRHSKYNGVFRSYSPETVRFAGPAAKILRYIFNTDGATEAVCFFEIARENNDSLAYETLVSCAIDFSQYKNSVHYVDVHLMEGGLSADLNAFDTTEYPIEIESPVTNTDFDFLWMDGVLFKGAFNYQTQEAGETFITIGTLGADFNTSILGMAAIGNEGEYGAGISQSVICDPTGTITALAGTFDEKWIFNAILAGTYSLTIDPLPITMLFSSASPHNMQVEIRARQYSSASFGSYIPGSELTIWSNTGGFVAPGTILSETTPLMFYTAAFPADSYLVLYFRLNTSAPHSGSGPADNVTIRMPQVPAAKARIRYDYIPPASPCRAISHSRLFKKLFHKLTESTAVNPISDLLLIPTDTTVEDMQIVPNNTFFTCGDALRRLYTDADGNTVNPILKTSISDFVNDAYISLGAGLGIERDASDNEVLRLERLQHFYQKDVLIKNLGRSISEWKMYPYTEYLANNYTLGSRDQNYDDINGRFEFNSEMKFKSKIKRVQNDSDITSIYRDDCYGATYTQINFANKETTDSESDNDVFKIQSDRYPLSGIDSVGVTPAPYRLDRTHTITAGLPADVAARVFNVAFTAKRKLYHLLPWIKSWFYGTPTPELKYMTAKKNSSLVSRLGLKPYITENADIALTATTADIIYQPWVFDFKVQVSMDVAELMATNPYGVMRHELYRRGQIHELDGFVLDIGINDASKEIYNVKLLCSPNTVIDDLL